MTGYESRPGDMIEWVWARDSLSTDDLDECGKRIVRSTRGPTAIWSGMEGDWIPTNGLTHVIVCVLDHDVYVNCMIVTLLCGTSLHTLQLHRYRSYTGALEDASSRRTVSSCVMQLA